MKILFLCVVSLFFLFSCSYEMPRASAVKGPSEGGKISLDQVRLPISGIYALEIVPKEATRTSTLSLVSTGFELSSAEIDWLVNGVPLTTAVPDRFEGSNAAKGSTVQARAVIEGQEVLSNIVQLVNASPEITKANLIMGTINSAGTISVEVEAADPDNDQVTILYEWTINGAPAGNGSVLEGSLRRGDAITVSVRPHDGEATGRAAEITRKIQNMPPMIENHKNFTFTNSTFAYQARANDPDGDSVRFSLASVPEGMKIDPSSGDLIWSVPPEFNGLQNVTIIADDEHGGTCRYGLSINLQGQ